MWVYISLGVSIALNIFLFWYVRQLVARHIFYVDNLSTLQFNLNGFVAHLDAVHQMEMFYGEPILEKMVKHSKTVKESVENFLEIFMIDESQMDEEFEWREYAGEEEEEEMSDE